GRAAAFDDAALRRRVSRRARRARLPPPSRGEGRQARRRRRRAARCDRAGRGPRGGAGRGVNSHSAFVRSMPADLIRGWIPVRIKKTRQNKKLESGSDSIRTDKALKVLGNSLDPTSANCPD